MSQDLLSGFALYLVEKNLLPDVNAQQLILAAKQSNISLISYLMQNNFMDAKTTAIAVADYFGLQFVDLSKYNQTDFALDSLNNQLILKYRALPLGLGQNASQLQLAITDPTNALSLNAIKFHTSRDIKPVIAEHDKLEYWINTLLQEKSLPPSVIVRNDESDKKTEEVTSLEKQDTKIIELVDQILSQAINKEASDIHFEPYEKFYRVRLRIDGVLYNLSQLSTDLTQQLTARLKVMAKLDIAERRIPQDGRFSLSLVNQNTRDCRISTCPTLFGEKVVVRILNPSNMALEVAQLGMDERQQQKFLECINAPQGMVLVTGPTGSGKTVTLYTALQLLNIEDQNISTVEDPVEINLPGINQVEVNHKIGLDFALALRAFLRQDPDVIMVGEIRDLETAQIAIKAAQTGHLVLSTLHTNSAAESITRMINMGVAAFNIISAVNLVIAQRLLRKLCPHCKKPINLAEEILQEYNLDVNRHKNTIFYQASECKKCKNGYKGRIGIFELLPISKSIAQMIIQQSSAMEIEQQAKREGMPTLREAALQVALSGATTLEEINRVVL